MNFILKLVGSFMFKRVAKFLVKAIVKSTKNTTDDNVYDLVIGQIDNKPELRKKAIKNLLKDGVDFVEGEIEDLFKKRK